MCGKTADYAYVEEVRDEATPEQPNPEPATKVEFVCEGCTEEIEEAMRQALLPVAEVIPDYANVRVLCDH